MHQQVYARADAQWMWWCSVNTTALMAISPMQCMAWLVNHAGCRHDIHRLQRFSAVVSASSGLKSVDLATPRSRDSSQDAGALGVCCG
jgi:hypothetical protein